MFKNIFNKNKEKKGLIEKDDIISEIFNDHSMERKIKEQNEKNNLILENELEDEYREVKKEKAYDYPNTNNSYFKSPYNDLSHDNLLIYGEENYFANQSIFKVIRENLRNGTGLIWFVTQKEFLNVLEMVKSDSTFFGYKNRIFTAFEVEEDFLEKALLFSHIYIVLKERTFEDDLTELKLSNDKLDSLKIKRKDSDFLPIVISSNITMEDISEKQIKSLNKYNINFLIYIKCLYNERAIDRYNNGIFNNFLILNKELRFVTLYDKELNKKIEEEIKKMKPMESFFINKNNIKYITF